MKLEITRFNKRSKVYEIKEHLESTFNCSLPYSRVYNEFRRQHPRFGIDDCQMFIEFLQLNGALFRQSRTSDNALCRLLFSTQKMASNFRRFGDILLIDSTYNTNLYSIPLVVLSGIDNNYKNVLFGLALVNDETKETYKWLLGEFCEMHTKQPGLIYSDQDLAITSAIEETLPNTPHRLCSWHIVRNLRRNFNFIKTDQEDLKEKIFKLPFLDKQAEFDNYVQDILKFFQDFDLRKSKEYFDKLLSKKTKWAVCYHEPHFDAGISTTSRAES